MSLLVVVKIQGNLRQRAARRYGQVEHWRPGMTKPITHKRSGHPGIGSAMRSQERSAQRRFSGASCLFLGARAPIQWTDEEPLDPAQGIKRQA